MCIRDRYNAQTVWPSGLRRWLKAPVRKGVGSNPTAVNFKGYINSVESNSQSICSAGPRQINTICFSSTNSDAITFMFLLVLLCQKSRSEKSLQLESMSRILLKVAVKGSCALMYFFWDCGLNKLPPASPNLLPCQFDVIQRGIPAMFGKECISRKRAPLSMFGFKGVNCDGIKGF